MGTYWGWSAERGRVVSRGNSFLEFRLYGGGSPSASRGRTRNTASKPGSLIVGIPQRLPAIDVPNRASVHRNR